MILFSLKLGCGCVRGKNLEMVMLHEREVDVARAHDAQPLPPLSPFHDNRARSKFMIYCATDAQILIHS